MNNKKRQAINVFVLAALFSLSCGGSLAKDKVWTIDSRAAELMQQINAGQKSGELTLKEAKKLRGDLADIAHRKHELKGDNEGKVSDEDRNKIEGDLNKVSAKIHKLELDKRIKHK